MENSYHEVFEISSDEEDNYEEEKPVDWLSDLLEQEMEDSDEVVVVGEVSASSVCRQQNKGDDDDDECLILDGDPDKPVEVEHDAGNESDELQVVGEKGQIACRDYPHPRHLCARYPFSSNPHEKYCDLCHCYVCDTQAPCKHWGTGLSSHDHCHSNDKEEGWKLQRKLLKEGKPATLLVPKIPVPPLVHKPMHPHPLNNGAPNFTQYSLSKTTTLRPCTSTAKYSVPNIIRNHQRHRSIKFPHHGKSNGCTVTAHPPSFKKVGTARYGHGSFNDNLVHNQLNSRQVRTLPKDLNSNTVQSTYQSSSQPPMGRSVMGSHSQYVVQPQVYSQPVPQPIQTTNQVYRQPVPQPVQTTNQVYSQPVPQPVQTTNQVYSHPVPQLVQTTQQAYSQPILQQVQSLNTTYQPVNPAHCGLDDSLPEYDWFNDTAQSLPPPPPLPPPPLPPPPTENPQYSYVQPTSTTVPPLVGQLSSATPVTQISTCERTLEPFPVTETITNLQSPAPTTTTIGSTEFELDSWIHSLAMLGSGNETLSSDFGFIHTEMDASLLTFDFENP